MESRNNNNSIVVVIIIIMAAAAEQQQQQHAVIDAILSPGHAFQAFWLKSDDSHLGSRTAHANAQLRVECEDMDWIQLAQGVVHVLNFVNTVTVLWSPLRAWRRLTEC
jgi:hypothetical protein